MSSERTGVFTKKNLDTLLKPLAGLLTNTISSTDG